MGVPQEKLKPGAPASKAPEPPREVSAGPRARIGFVRSAASEFHAQSAKTQRGLMAKLKELAFNPQLGKPLTGALRGCARVTYGRMRCVVRVAEGVAVVLVLVVAERKAGSREDAYAVATELVAANEPEVKDLLAKHVRAYLQQQPPRPKGEAPPSGAAEVKARRKDR